MHTGLDKVRILTPLKQSTNAAILRLSCLFATKYTMHLRIFVILTASSNKVFGAGAILTCLVLMSIRTRQH